jgi:hypothetical protein
MTLETFKTAIDKLPWDTRIDFSGMAEAWVNPECSDMLAYALERGHDVAIYTTLYNWDNATVDRVADLLSQYTPQIEVFSIHFPDEYGNMKGWKYSTEWEYAFRAMSGIVQHLGIKLEAMTMSDHGKIHQDLQHLGIQLYNWFGHNRAGSLNTEQVREQPINFVTQHDKPVVCGKAPNYDQTVLLPNGDVVLCCMDYDNKHVLGNLLTQSYQDLFTGPEMLMILQENAKSCYSNKSLCKSCTDAKVVDTISQ